MSLKKGAYNSVVGLVSMLMTGGISFLRISMIINLLGTEFNGLNNLYTQIFSFIMIGEAGLSLATTTSLYKYISDNDISKINQIVSGSRKTLSIIMLLLLIVASLVSLFIPYFIKDNTFANGFIIGTFLLFTFKALLMQFLQPFKGYIAAKQDEYFVRLIGLGTTLFIAIGELIILVLFQNFIAMLVYGVLATMIAESITYIIYKKKYPEINMFAKEKDYQATKHLKNLVKVNIVSTVAKSVDPIIISRFLGLIFTSLYSNYSYVQNFLLSIVGTALNGFTHMFGQMFSQKNSATLLYFERFIVITNLIATIVSVTFFVTIGEFVSVWINSESILPVATAFLFSILIYMYTMMRPINVLVTTNQFFDLASKSAIYETIINLVISVVLINFIGLNGVLLGSIISFAIASFWYFPINTYKQVFEVSSVRYFKKQIVSVIILLVTSMSIYLISTRGIFVDVPRNLIFIFIKMTIVFAITTCMTIAMYFVVFRETKFLMKMVYQKIKNKTISIIT